MQTVRETKCGFPFPLRKMNCYGLLLEDTNNLFNRLHTTMVVINLNKK